ncbi:MAG: response regulator [SAR324 cluster bacterium]|nr:response regulator [SAR324 cluster bacterium]
MSNFAIVCVDDEKIILNSLKTELNFIAEKGWTLELAESGEEALEIIEEFEENGTELAVIVSDQIMPGMKGDELLIQIHPRHPNTAKILLTGQANADAVGNAVNHANLYRFIAKPWDSSDLVMTVNEAAKKYIADQQLEEQNKIIDDLNSNVIEHFIKSEEVTLNDDELYDKIFFQRFLNFLEPEVREWVILATIGLICADGKVTKSEVLFINALVSLDRDPEKVHRIVEMVKARKVPRVEILKAAPEKIRLVLVHLYKILVRNGGISANEVKFLIYLGGRLGIDKKMTQDFVDLALNEIHTNHGRSRLLEIVENSPPVYNTFTE